MGNEGLLIIGIEKFDSAIAFISLLIKRVHTFRETDFNGVLRVNFCYL